MKMLKRGRIKDIIIENRYNSKFLKYFEGRRESKTNPIKFDGVWIYKNIKYRVFARDNFTCQHCGLKGTFLDLIITHGNPTIGHLRLYAMKNGKKILMTIDHWIPKSKDGLNELDNLITMCEPCNTRKSNLLPEEWLKLKNE